MSNPTAEEQAAGAICQPHGIAHLLPPFTLTVGQLRRALQIMGDDDHETELSFQHKLPGKDTDGEDAPAGVYCWLTEYPEEGALQLPKDINPPSDAIDLVHTLRALVGERQPLGIDRPTYQNALRELAKWEHIPEATC